MRDVLSGAGLYAGHEDWFNPTGRVLDGLDVDVSWLAVPFVERREHHGPVVLVTRDPVACVRALVGAHFLTSRTSRWTRFALEAEPDLAGMYPAKQAIQWWIRWNERAANVADLVVKVEDVADPVTLSRIGKALGYDDLPTDAAASISIRTHHGGRRLIDAGMIHTLLDGRASQFGYCQ